MRVDGEPENLAEHEDGIRIPHKLPWGAFSGGV